MSVSMWVVCRHDSENRHLAVYYITLLLCRVPDSRTYFLSVGLESVLDDMIRSTFMRRSLAIDALSVAAKRARSLMPSDEHRNLAQSLVRKPVSSASIIVSLYRVESIASVHFSYKMKHYADRFNQGTYLASRCGKMLRHHCRGSSSHNRVSLCLLTNF